jgi:tripartite-type tricarboxylate transporter receptor subunit TctC
MKLKLLCAAVFSAFAASAAFADTYPARAVTLIVPFPAGGPADGLARAYASEMEKKLGQSVVVDNRPGGGTMTGVTAVSSADPDGYTLGFTASAVTIQPTVNPSLNFDPVRDLTAISMLVEPIQALAVNTKSGLNSVADLIAKAKANPGRVTFASTGQGTATHIGGEYFAQFAGVEMVHVPYQGSAPAVVDLLAGRVDMLVDAISGPGAYFESGELKPLATTGPQRSGLTPDIPTVAETLPGWESRSFIGLIGPAALPQDIVDRLSAASAEAMADPALRERVKMLSMDVISSDPATFKAQIERDTEKWAKILKDIGLVPAN